MTELIKTSFQKLATYCEQEDFKGFDPYDGLNSKLFQALPLLKKNKLARLAWIQLFKKSPVNLRPITGVKKDYNPKALGLFLSGYCNLYKLDPQEKYLEKIVYLSDKLMALMNREWSGACWGYNFDWQARAFFQPKNTPTVVATSFIVNSLLDAYEILKESKLLEISRSACSFVLKDLNRTYNRQGDFVFSYSPLDKSVVFNASLLGSRLLARVYSYTGEKELIQYAGKSVAYCCNYQKSNGEWSYGILPFHDWVDSFHTGYNLECISEYMKYSGDKRFNENLKKGFDYYLKTFFTDEGVSKYYNNSVYPIDIHCPAQLVMTVSRQGKFNDHKDLVDKVLDWTIMNMQSRQGYFFYQIHKYFSSGIPYMRWAQSWMFYALSEYLKKISSR